MANPTDNLPGFNVPGLLPTINPIPQVQPARLALQTPVPAQPPTVVPASGFVPRGPTPYGVPGQTLPVMQPSAQAVAPAAAAPAPAAAAPAPAPAPAAAAAAAGAPAAQQDAVMPTPIADTRTRVALPAAFSAANVTQPGGGMGSTPAVGGTGQIGPFRDPTGVISAGYDRQQAYGQHFLNQALDYIGGGANIWEQATRGRAIAGILHAVAGQNNEGSAQASGANSLNSSIAGLEGASLGAQSQMYNADSNLLAGQQRNATSLDAAKLDLQGRTQPIGQTQSYDPSTQQYTTISNYAQSQVGPGGMVTLKPIAPPTRQGAAPKLIEKATSVDQATGKPIVVKNGQWVFTEGAK